MTNRVDFTRLREIIANNNDDEAFPLKALPFVQAHQTNELLEQLIAETIKTRKAIQALRRSLK